jgi:hypothetical protein
MLAWPGEGETNAGATTGSKEQLAWKGLGHGKLAQWNAVIVAQHCRAFTSGRHCASFTFEVVVIKAFKLIHAYR